MRSLGVGASPADVRTAVAEVVADADAWLTTPNELLYGEAPNEFVQKGEGQRILDLIAAIKHGLPY